jgi:hypothetical protein
MNTWIMRLAVFIWLLALIGVLVFRGQAWANIILLVVSLGMIVLGLVLSRQNKQ